jgi:hypothetical protein
MDSFEGLLFQPLSLHKYLYAHGSPVNRIDPSGRISEGAIGLLAVSGIGASIGALSAGVAAEAQGRAVTLSEIAWSASVGAVLSPLAAVSAPIAVGLGIGGAVYSTLSFGPTVFDPYASPQQRRAAAALMLVSYVGAAQAAKQGFADETELPFVSQIRLNQTKGANAEQDFVTQAIAAGWRLVGTQIRVRSHFHPKGRTVDAVLESPQGRLHGFELKSSRAEFNRVNTQQNAADVNVNRFGMGRMFGKRARGARVEGRTLDSITKVLWERSTSGPDVIAGAVLGAEFFTEGGEEEEDSSD